MTGVQVWSRVRLAEVADVASGAGFPTAYQGEKEGDFPFYKVSDMNLPGNEVHMRSHNNAISEEARKKLRAKPFPAGSVIFPKIGAAIATNKKRVLTRPSCADNNVMAVIPREGVLLPEFLLYLFSRKNLSDFASDSNPPSIRKTEVEDWEISIPPIGEQRRIVDILNHAASIRRLREEARLKIVEVVPALFFQFFGDSPYLDWPVLPFGELVRETQLGIVRGAREMDEGYPFPYVRMDSICSGGSLRLTGLKRVQASKEEADRYSLRKGDFLFNTRNSRELVGKVAHFDGGGRFLYNNNIMAVRFGERVLTRYMVALFQTSALQAHLEPMKSGTTSVFAIYYKNLVTLPIPVPPRPLQQEFAERVAEVEGISSLNDRAATAAEQMAESLLAQLFGQAA